MPGPNEKLVRLSEAEAARLFEFYGQAETEILNELNKGLLKGNDTRYLQGMLQNVQAILNDLLNGSQQWCEEALPQVYIAGAEAAGEQIEAAGGRVIAGFGAIHQQAARVLAESALNRFNDLTSFIGRRVNDIYRALALENVRGSVVGYKSWQQVAKNYREQLAEQGITGFKDVKGRQWNMRSYADMVSRTTTMEAHLEGTKNRLLEHDRDLVKISRHSNPCPLCRPWEGQILSLTGRTEGYRTLDEAKGFGLFHPRCKHAFGLFLPELAGEPEETKSMSQISRESEAAKKDYLEFTKEQRQVNEARKQWQKYMVRLPNDTPKTFSAFLSMKRANSEKYQELQQLYREVGSAIKG